MLPTHSNREEDGAGYRGYRDPEKVNSDLISTIEDTLKIQADGKAKRLMAETELVKIEQELKEKLLLVRA